MAKPWTDADAQRLKELRLKAGLDRAAFARRSSLSVAQLTELEEGPAGTSRFYGDRIKSHSGHNALARLGYRPPVEVPPQPLETAPQAPAAPAQDLMPEPVTAPARDLAPEPEPDLAPQDSEAAAPWQSTSPSPLDALPPAPLPAPAEPASPVTAPAAPSRRRWTLTVVAVVVAAGAAVIFLPPLRTSTPPASADAPVLAASPLPVASSLPEPSGVPPQAAPASTVVMAEAASPASVPQAAPAIVQVADTSSSTAAPVRCDTPPADAPEFTPPRALRPASYVFMQASRDISVCVVDGRNQQTQGTVKPGEGLTVNGEAPFTILTAQWGELRVFFQGVRVQVDAPAPQAVVLRAR